jgi:hypothetical protein
VEKCRNVESLRIAPSCEGFKHPRKGAIWTVRGLHEGSVEVARVIGSCRVARWLEVGETHHPGFEGQYESLISFQPTSLDHFTNSGFVSLEGRPNSWFHEVLSCAEQGRRSKPLDPSNRRTVGPEPPWGIAYRGFGG